MFLIKHCSRTPVQTREVVDFQEIIGKYVDPSTGKSYDTTMGTIHYSKEGAHIVPARPKNIRSE